MSDQETEHPFDCIHEVDRQLTRWRLPDQHEERNASLSRREPLVGFVANAFVMRQHGPTATADFGKPFDIGGVVRKVI